MNQEEFRFTCELPNGLHARPASYLVRHTQGWEADIILRNLRNKREANAKSVLSLIAADICYHDACTILIKGTDCRSAVRKIKHFVINELPGCDAVIVDADQTDWLPPSLVNIELDACHGQVTGEGWGRGVPVCLKEYRFLPGEDHPVYSGVTGERLRLLGALKQVKQRLKTAISEVDLMAEREVLNAHLALASDPDFRTRLLEHVDNGLSVVESIEATLEHFSQVLQSGESSYLRDRVVDIRDLCDQVLRLSYGSGRLYTPDVLVQNSICLADNLTPSQFLALDKHRLKGLVLQTGGKASHTVLLARARGIPVIVGAKGALDLMQRSKEVVLDAGLGLIIANPGERVNRYYQQEYRKQKRLSERCLPFIEPRGMTSDGRHVEIAGNIVGIEDVEQVFSSGAESIGLFRTEMLFMERSQAPEEEEQLAIYRNVMRQAAGRSVIIRTIDVGADKPVDYLKLDDEQNPFLGYRAVRLYPQFVQHFKTQLRAVFQASMYGAVKVMVPMITTLDEVLWVRKVIAQVKSELKEENKKIRDVPFGIMLEVPSCVFIIDQLAEYVDFFSLGTNDLAQYFLAADRGNERVSSLYSYLHPSFLRMLEKVSTEVASHNKWLGICGDMAADLKALPLLIGLGVNELSVPAGVIPEMKERLSHLQTDACRELLHKAMNSDNQEQVERLLQLGRIESGSYPIMGKNILIMDLDAVSKEEVIKELVDAMDIDGRLIDACSVEDAVWQREQVYSTGLGYGIAIPHCQSNDIYSDSIGIARLRTSVDWQSMDNHPVDLVFLLAVRKSGAQENHMRIFANLARKLVNEAFLKQVRECSTSEDTLELLGQELDFS